MGAQLIAGLGNAWSSLVSVVPKLLGFLVILFIGWLIAKALAKAVGFLLKRIGFDRLVEKSGLNAMLARSSFDPANLLVKLVYYFVLLIVLQLAFGAFGPGNPVSNLLNDIIAYLPRVLVAVVLVFISAAIARGARDLVTSALGTRSYTKTVGTIVYVLIFALGIIAAVNQLGIATLVTTPVLITALATVGGILIVGLGGGLIRPMQGRWEEWLARLQQEASQRPAAGGTRAGSSVGAAQPTQHLQAPGSAAPTQHLQAPGAPGATGSTGGAHGQRWDPPTPPQGIDPR